MKAGTARETVRIFMIICINLLIIISRIRDLQTCLFSVSWPGDHKPGYRLFKYFLITEVINEEEITFQSNRYNLFEVVSIRLEAAFLFSSSHLGRRLPPGGQNRDDGNDR